MAKPKTNPFIPPSDSDELIVWLDARRERAERRLPTMRMKMNMAFMLGHQWVAWDPRDNRWVRPTTDTNDPNASIRLEINKIGPIVERAVSKLTKENPLPECRPASDDDEDVSAAKSGTRMISHEMSRLDWQTFLTSFMFLPTTLGWSYVHVAWDPEGGEPVELASEEDLEDEDDGGLNQGNIVLEEVPAWELSIDPSAVQFDDARWAVRTVCITKEAVWERWGKHDIEGAAMGRTILDEVNDLTNNNGVSAQKDNAKTDFVKVHQFWLRPGSRSKPEGMVVTWCGNTILEGPMPYPYKHGRLPFVPIQLLPGLHAEQGRTWVDDLIPMQTDYNDARSREAELRRTLTPKVFYPVGSINPDMVTSRLQLIPFAAVNGKPDIVVPDSGWMQQFEQGMGRADAEMGERSGQSDATSASNAASMPAASILALQEADDTKLAISAKLLAAGVQHVGWHILRLIQQFWTEDRLVRTWSEDGDLEALRLSGADVQNVLDVHVESGSTLPRSKASRTQLAMELAPLGLFPDPRYLFRILDLPGSEFMMEHLNVDAKQAQRENSQLRLGLTVEVHTFDNHAVHITEHDTFRKSQEYLSLDDETRGLFDGHVDTHHSLALQVSQVPGGSTPQVDSANMPPVPGTYTDPANMVAPPAAEGTPPAGGTPMYVNPSTGTVNDPLAVAAGQQPSPLASGPKSIRNAAGIGKAGQPGAVGNPDSQAASIGN